MKLTPADVRSQCFQQKLRGYNREEVDEFLVVVAREFEKLYRENLSLKEGLMAHDKIIESLRTREESVRDALVTAQKLSNDVKINAEREADIILAEADQKAAGIVAGASQRANEIVSEIEELKQQRERLRIELEKILESHLALLQTYQDVFVFESGKVVGKEGKKKKNGRLALLALDERKERDREDAARIS